MARTKRGWAASASRVLERPGARLAIFAGIAAAACGVMLERAAGFNPFRDHQVLFAYERAAELTVERHGQIPLWNPFYCGGMYLLGTPQSRFASPTFLFTLLFGAQRAEAFTAFVLTIAGMEGFYRYARLRCASAIGPTLAAALFALQGMFASAYFMGWINFFGFEIVPWVLFGTRAIAMANPRGIWAVGLGFAFIVGFGGTYAAPVAALLATAEALRYVLMDARRDPRRWDRIVLLFLAGALAIALGAFRLWPIAEELARGPRIMAGAPGNDLRALARFAFESAEPAFGNLRPDGLFFYPITALGIAAIGLTTRRGLYPAVMLLLSVWTALGHHEHGLPFPALRSLPIFEDLRYPERFLFPAALFATELAAIGVDRLLPLRRRSPLRTALALSAAAVLFHATTAAVSHHRMISDAMTLESPPRAAPAPTFRQARGNRWLAAHYPDRNRGSISCWEAYPVPMSDALRGDLPAEAYLVDEGAGRVTLESFSPNRIVLHTSLHRPARVRVNQNHHPGFRASVGEVVSDEGLLSVELPAGEHRIVIRFAPLSAFGGGVTSLIALLSIFLVHRAFLGPSGRSRVGTILVAVALPVLPATAIHAARDVPEVSGAALRNADGTPLAHEALPSSAHPLDARFALPVELVGASLPEGPDRRGIFHMALYFRRKGDLPRSLGVFVHVVDANGRLLTADHRVVGGSTYLSDARHDVVLRDAFAFFPRRPLRMPLRVFAGLWHPGQAGSRVEVRGADADEQGSRVFVGTIPPGRDER